jgi:hypothetical protein
MFYHGQWKSNVRIVLTSIKPSSSFYIVDRAQPVRRKQFSVFDLDVKEVVLIHWHFNWRLIPTMTLILTLVL